ncbi:MAG: recombinase family protein, partial [Verrucomicrobiota bacterium]|nr:recombinase family protein [Verrucomicrobiota bacterium]
MPDPSKTVKIYSVLRVSTTEQAHDDKSGLPTQRRIITKWLKRNSHPQGVEVIDSGLSARNLAQFEYGKLGKLLQKLEKQTFEPSSVMLVFAFSDRFSRADPTKGLQKFLEVLNLG